MRRRSARSAWRVAGSIVLGLLATVLLVMLATVASLRWLNPPTTAFMLEARAHAWWAGERHYRTEYRWKSLEEISPQAALAVIAAEDQEFPFHYGFDFTSIRAAVRAHERGARLRGASTISQQVAKNLFLSADRSLARKGIEALLTVMIETCWPKERILEVYLNVVQFGYGVYGVEAAARHYFRVPAAQLTAPQSALLAAVLPNPRRLHVNAPSRYVLAQRDHILQQMANLGGAAYLRAIEPTAASSRSDAAQLSPARERE